MDLSFAWIGLQLTVLGGVGAVVFAARAFWFLGRRSREFDALRAVVEKELATSRAALAVLQREARHYSATSDVQQALRAAGNRLAALDMRFQTVREAAIAGDLEAMFEQLPLLRRLSRDGVDALIPERRGVSSSSDLIRALLRRVEALLARDRAETISALQAELAAPFIPGRWRRVEEYMQRRYAGQTEQLLEAR